MPKLQSNFALSTLFFVTVLAIGCQPSQQQEPPAGFTGAYESLQLWAQSRAYPEAGVDDRLYLDAFDRQLRTGKTSTEPNTEWRPIGPLNIGGRMLSVALNPENPETIWAGSASGGLWMSRKGGVGGLAWKRVPLGHPVLGVSTIAIAPDDTARMYIGTGEVYRYADTHRGNPNRSTRGSYGIGILRSTDGGETWTRSLDWTDVPTRGVQKIILNPMRSESVWAATTEGTYYSADGGESWEKAHDVIMATDIVINPADTTEILIACGNLGSEGKGIYRSLDGETFRKTTSGVPSSFIGKIQLTLHPTDPRTVYASMGDGLTTSTPTKTWLLQTKSWGNSWTSLSRQNYAAYQGWYSHFVAVHPTKPDTLLLGGVDIYRSDNNGVSMQQVSTWRNAPDDPPIGNPAAFPDDYAHADHHAYAHHPDNPDVIYIANDGGIFRSDDFGMSYDPLVGSLQTTQFYNGTAHSVLDSTVALGGLQDNGSILYDGTKRWSRTIFADGGWQGLDPTDENIMYSSAQRGATFRTFDKGFSWTGISPPDGATGFIMPFVVAPSRPEVIYAGRNIVYRSLDRGDSWDAKNTESGFGGNPVFSMAVSPDDYLVVFIGTAPLTTLPEPDPSPPAVFMTRDGGRNWTKADGLPNRYPTDITFKPGNDQVAYVTFSGFGTGHVFRTDNSGITWDDITGDLPDVPTSAVLVDPENTDHVYVGNDLGVWVSRDEGFTWETFSVGLAEALISSDLGYSPQNRMLRLATHGNGMFQRSLDGIVVSNEPIANVEPGTLEVYPNPASHGGAVDIEWGQLASGRAHVSVFDARGRRVLSQSASSDKTLRLSLDGLAPGVYFVRAATSQSVNVAPLTIAR